MSIVKRNAPSAAKRNKKEKTSYQTRAASQSSTILDNRQGTLAQMKVSEAMSQGPQFEKITQLQAVMNRNVIVGKR